MLVNVKLSNSKKLFGFLFIKLWYNSNKKNIIVKIISQEGYWMLGYMFVLIQKLKS